MDDFITIYYWVRLAVLVAVALIALITAIRMSTRRTLRGWREVLLAVLVLVLFVGLSAIVGVTFGPLYAGVLALVGVIVGYFANRGATVSAEEGRRRVRPSPLAAWVWFVAVTLVVATLLFAESYTFALAMLVLAFAVGVVVGQTAALLLGSSREAAAATPEVTVT